MSVYWHCLVFQIKLTILRLGKTLRVSLSHVFLDEMNDGYIQNKLFFLVTVTTKLGVKPTSSNAEDVWIHSNDLSKGHEGVNLADYFKEIIGNGCLCLEVILWQNIVSSSLIRYLRKIYGHISIEIVQISDALEKLREMWVFDEKTKF